MVPKLNWSTPRVSACDGHVIIDACHVMSCDGWVRFIDLLVVLIVQSVFG